MKSHWPISTLSTVSSLINMLLPLMLVRLLSADELGTFRIFFLYLTILPSFSFTPGLVNGLVYWAGRTTAAGAARGDGGLAPIRATSLLIFLISAFLTVAALAVRAPLASFFGWSIDNTTLFAAGILGTIASTYYEEAAIATGRIWSGALFSSIFDLFRTSLILAAAYFTRDLRMVFIAHLSIQLLKSVVGYALGYRQGLVGFSWPKDAIRAVWRYAGPVSFASLFAVFAGYSDQLILSKYLSTVEFAFYSIGCLTVPPLITLEYSVARVLIPQLSAAFAISDSPGAAKLYRRAVDELAFLLVPAVVGMIVFATPIVELLFTKKYSSADQYLRLYALTYLALMIPYDSVARARAQSGWILKNFLAVSAVTLAICFLGTLQWGAMGALVGLVVSRVLLRVSGLYQIKRTTPWRWSDFLPLAHVTAYTSICLVLAALCMAVRLQFASPLRWFIVCGGLFTVAYFPLVIGVNNAIRRRGNRGPVRVLMLTQYLGIGGLERMILNLCVTLRDRGKCTTEVYVFDHARDWPAESHLTPAFEVEKIPVLLAWKPKGFSLKSVFKIALHLFKNEIDVIHSHDLGALIYAACAKIVTFGRVRLVHTQHSFVHLDRKKRYVIYERFFTLFVDVLTVVSEDTKATYVKLGVPEKKIRVIPNGVRFAPLEGREAPRRKTERAKLVERFPSLATHEADLWLVYLARIHTGKGQDHAIALWNELPAATRARATLLLIGPETDQGRVAFLRGLIAQSADRERIRYLGPVQDPLPWLMCADVYISGSDFEGMPLGPIEAAGSGVPIFLSQIKGHAILTTETNSWPLSEAKTGAERLGRILSALDPESARQTAATVRANYSMDAMAARYEEGYGR